MPRSSIHSPFYASLFSSQAQYPPHRGVASIEFLMMMPVLVAFVAVTFWAARVLIAGIHAGQVAEETVRELAASSHTIAELGRLPALEAVQSTELEQLVRGFDPRLRIDGGLVTAQSVQESGDGVTGVMHAAGPATDRHFTLTHAWESQLFSFPPSSSAQPPLTLPSSIRGIAPDIQDVAEFRGLLTFKSFAPGNLSQLSRVATRITNATFALDQDCPSSRRELRRSTNRSPCSSDSLLPILPCLGCKLRLTNFKSKRQHSSRHNN